MIETGIAFLNLFLATCGIIGLFLIMVIQAGVAPLPSDIFPVLAVISGMHFLTVVLVALLDLTVGGFVDFYLIKRGAKPYFERLISKMHIKKLESRFNRWGAYALVLGRATPFISSDALAHIACISSMRLKTFSLFVYRHFYHKCHLLCSYSNSLIG